ncbi:hypothetical protein CAPTEDRAFT_212910 [Capitella teleta]|uniref:YEATS domain-containing protein n=1 Tax=Capitella teleta TaxID=283909 RepID=R7TQR4_CAPTE|nr:hypothetical protein CAPTEDRAFT_212910 [Capitella teleta]|eukprot:ELT93365.1 hypothetical protein CAPTEDRAFT_212910 [Capitella teleta]
MSGNIVHKIKEATVKKIEDIIRRQFAIELQNKESEIERIDRNLYDSRRLLDHLRACIVSTYYTKAQQTHVQAKIPQNTTPGIHPAIRQHSGKAPRESDKPASSKCLPETTDTKIGVLGDVAMAPKDTSVDKSADQNKGCSTVDLEGGRSRFKVKKRIVIGNISKWIGGEHRDELEHATHKWMMYVRGPRDEPAIDHFVSKVWFFLHPSYRPHDLVEITQPPFHLTRRGWGEFPVRVQLHFKDPRNKKSDVIHNLKLDRTYTGLQTLGSETLIDVELERDSIDSDNGRPSFPDLMRIQPLRPNNTESRIPELPANIGEKLREARLTSADAGYMTPPPEPMSSHPAWPQLNIKCEIPEAGPPCCLTPSDALSSPGASSQNNESDPGWMRVQIKSEPTTPDQNSACSGWTDITHLSTPDKDSQGSVRSSPLSFTSETGSRSNDRVASPANMKITIGEIGSPSRSMASFQIGRMGGTRQVKEEEEEVKEVAAKTPSQMVYMKCQDASGKILLVPQQLLTKTPDGKIKAAAQVGGAKSVVATPPASKVVMTSTPSPIVITPTTRTVSTNVTPSSTKLTTSASPTSSATSPTTSSSKTQTLVLGKGANQAVLTYVLAPNMQQQQNHPRAQLRPQQLISLPRMQGQPQRPLLIQTQDGKVQLLQAMLPRSPAPKPRPGESIIRQQMVLVGGQVRPTASQGSSPQRAPVSLLRPGLVMPRPKIRPSTSGSSLLAKSHSTGQLSLLTDRSQQQTQANQKSLLTAKIGNQTVLIKVEPQAGKEKDLSPWQPEEAEKRTENKHLIFKSIRNQIKKEERKYLFELDELSSMEDLIKLIVKKHPLVLTDKHPEGYKETYSATNLEQFMNWNIGKRRAMEGHEKVLGDQNACA